MGGRYGEGKRPEWREVRAVENGCQRGGWTGVKMGENARLAILEVNGKWEGVGKKFEPFDGGGAEGSSG